MICVDAAIHRRRGTKTPRAKLWGHLFSDCGDLEELRVFAIKMGLKKRRLHDDRYPHRPTLVHFDITAEERLKAIELGAAPVDRKYVVRCIHTVYKRR